MHSGRLVHECVKVKLYIAAVTNHMLSMVLQGQHNRHVAGHGLNVRSSRSHTVFTLWIETVDAGMQSTAVTDVLGEGSCMLCP